MEEQVEEQRDPDLGAAYAGIAVGALAVLGARAVGLRWAALVYLLGAPGSRSADEASSTADAAGDEAGVAEPGR